MRTNNAYIAGSLKEDKYDLYAKYLVKYLRAYAGEGVKIWALTPGNAPLHAGDVESMGFTAQQARLGVRRPNDGR